MQNCVQGVPGSWTTGLSEVVRQPRAQTVRRHRPTHVSVCVQEGAKAQGILTAIGNHKKRRSSFTHDRTRQTSLMPPEKVALSSGHNAMHQIAPTCSCRHLCSRRPSDIPFEDLKSPERGDHHSHTISRDKHRQTSPMSTKRSHCQVAITPCTT